MYWDFTHRDVTITPLAPGRIGPLEIGFRDTPGYLGSNRWLKQFSSPLSAHEKGERETNLGADDQIHVFQFNSKSTMLYKFIIKLNNPDNNENDNHCQKNLKLTVVRPR
jgi:hypothetical protein